MPLPTLKRALARTFGAPGVRLRVAKLAPLPGVKEIGIEIERKR